MSNDAKQTTLEKISGHPLATTTVNIIPLLMGGVTALLPALFGTLAFGRFQKRVEKSLLDISSDLETQKEKLDNLTDAQFKLINEITSTVLSTINEEKLTYLRNAINNAIDEDKILDHESVLISRIIRDISVDEINFLLNPMLNGQKYEKILIMGDEDIPDYIDKHNTLRLSHKSTTTISLVLGLNNLGLLLDWSGLGGGSSFAYTSIAEKVRNLLREKPDK
jgi:hypothetical protein